MVRAGGSSCWLCGCVLGWRAESDGHAGGRRRGSSALAGGPLMLEDVPFVPYTESTVLEKPSDKEVELRREIARLKLEVANLAKKAGQVDFAFDVADRERAEKMKCIRAINLERQEMVKLSADYAAKDRQLLVAAEQAEKLQGMLSTLLTRVDELEEERDQMESAMSKIQSIAEDKDMTALKAGQLVGKLATKLHASAKDRKRSASAANAASTVVQTQMVDLMSNLSRTAASAKTVATVGKFIKRLKDKLKFASHEPMVSSSDHVTQTSCIPGQESSDPDTATPDSADGPIEEAKKRRGDYAYPPGTSLMTTATELEAMVTAGTLSIDQMHAVLAAQRNEDLQNILEQDQDHPNIPRQCQDQAIQCNLGENDGMSVVDDLLRNARRKQLDDGRHRGPANGRWTAGFWVPEPWRASAAGTSRAEYSATKGVCSKLQ